MKKNDWYINLFFGFIILCAIIIMFLLIYFNSKPIYNHPLKFDNEVRKKECYICVIKGHQVEFLIRYKND